MELQTTNRMTDQLLLNSSVINGDTFPLANTTEDFKSFFQQLRLPWFNDLLIKSRRQRQKKVFLYSRATSI